MASSSTSSPAKPARDPASPWPARERFSLTGPSQPLDPAHFPIRRDLADIALANRAFAPHYARALLARASKPADIRASADADAKIVATLETGDAFRVLEVGKRFAWGQAGDDGAIGYVDRHALTADPA